MKKNNTVIFSTSLVLSVALGVVLISSQSYEQDEIFKFSQKVTPVTVPESMSFAGEEVPLDNFDVKERVERELLSNVYFHSQTFYYLKLANRWLPQIEAILQKNNIPIDFKYLAVAESGLQNVISPARAEGFWQFRKATAIEYGLEVNDVIDERYHLEKATEAACKYLQKSYDDFGSWAMAAASYNCGIRRLQDASEDQGIDNYYDLYLNTETGRYVYRILAIKAVLENPKKFGFYIAEKDLYQPIPYTAYKVENNIEDLNAFAKGKGANYKMLKLLNPWLRQPYIKNISGKDYEIKIPS